MFFGLTPAAAGIARLTELRNQVADDPLLEAQTLRALGGFIAMTGDVDEGRRLVAGAREVVADFGFRWLLGGFPFVTGSIELYAGDLEAAEREYRSGIEIYESMGETGRASTLTANLAEVFYRQGRLDEADELALRARALSAEDDVSTHVGSRLVRGKVLARKGSIAEGERLVREAWELASGTQYLPQQAGAANALAEVLTLAGKAEESSDFLRLALELHEQKGNRIMAERTRELLQSP
jgi:tetratricopeptide (TPR) repeat protein